MSCELKFDVDLEKHGERGSYAPLARARYYSIIRYARGKGEKGKGKEYVRSEEGEEER